jgi:hypothetical protein
MIFPESSIENLCGLGYTESEARFLYLVATHSGYFSARQYLVFTGAKSGEKNLSFTQKVLAKGHARVRLLLRNGRLYHLYSRLLYRALGRENLRNRREHSTEYIRTKLAILDFVLAHLDYRYLETESEKVHYFTKQLGLSREVLPAKRYSGAIRERTTDRYFVDKFPLFLAPDSSSPAVVTFSFVDAGLLSLSSFSTHLLDYSSLLASVPQPSFVYIATRARHFEAARKLFQAMAPRCLNPDPGVEGLRYFHHRLDSESERYDKLTTDQIEFLNRSKKRFEKEAQIESLYRPFVEGKLPGNLVAEAFRKLAPKREVPFRTELVDGQAALFETKVSGRSRQQTARQAGGGRGSAFGTAFQPDFGAGEREAEEN